MTTITINEKISGLAKTEFKTIEEFLLALREVAPMKLYHADTESFSKKTVKAVKKSKNNQDRKFTNFQG